MVRTQLFDPISRTHYTYPPVGLPPALQNPDTSPSILPDLIFGASRYKTFEILSADKFIRSELAV